MIVQNVDQLPTFEGVHSLIMDTETSGLSPHSGDRICGIAVCSLDDAEKKYYVPIRHCKLPRTQTENQKALFESRYMQYEAKYTMFEDTRAAVNLPVTPVFEWLRKLLDVEDRYVIFHNAKFDLGMLRADGIEPKCMIGDTIMLVHSVKSNFPNYTLDNLTKWIFKDFKHVQYEKLCNWFKETLGINLNTNKIKEGDEPPNFSFVPIELLGPYAEEDLEATRQLACWAFSRLMREPIRNQDNPSRSQKELMGTEQALVRVLFEMENRGVRIDLDALNKLRERTVNEIEQYSGECYRLAREPFNVGSTKETADALGNAGGRVLFWNKPKTNAKRKPEGITEQDLAGKQKADQYTRDKTKSTGNACFNSSAVLEYLKQFTMERNKPGFQFIYNYYQADHRSRILSTYLDGILGRIDSDRALHANFNAHGTLHGRFSSSKINLQNITVSEGNRDLKQLEKFLGQKDDAAINRLIRNLFIPREGYTWVCIDWKQIEYVVATYFSNDSVMIKKFYDDPDLDYHAVTAEMAKIDRSTAKTVNFGVLYGMGYNSLAAMLGIAPYDAKNIIERMFYARPALKALIDNTQAFVRKNGCVLNPFGRTVPVPRNKEYVGLNYLVAGTVGDAMKDRMVAVFKWLRKEKLLDVVRMLLTVHDEIDYEIRSDMVDQLVVPISDIMCDIPEIRMPIRCDIEVGKSWGEVEKWERKVA